MRGVTTELGPLKEKVEEALRDIGTTEIMERIWRHDHTVWRDDPAEISNRLGWLHAPETMQEAVGPLAELVERTHADGFTDAVLLGMGGSSLAPEGFYETFGPQAEPSKPKLDLIVIDSTDPDMIAGRTSGLDLTKTVFIVATKSGGTIETLSAFKYFYNRTAEVVGRERAGEHFLAITDPGSRLVDMAAQYRFRQTFLKIAGLLDRALTAVHHAKGTDDAPAGENLAEQLGAIMGEAAKAGRDKLTIVTSPAIASFADWVEQLVAESTGKDGTGILPVVGEPLGPPEVYGDDRVFVHLRMEADSERDEPLATLARAGHPVVTLVLRDLYDLGAQFFIWEMATAVAGARLGIHPFDQPDVEAAKVLAKSMVASYLKDGALPEDENAPPTKKEISAFFAQAKAGDYVAFQAYVNPTPETDAALAALQRQVRDRYKLATTSGYGPRFLHSTGQLHKGDGGNGLFVQLISDPVHDLLIPEEAGESTSSITFGVLKRAQALGDAQALEQVGRRVIRFHLGTDVAAGLVRLGGALA